MGSNGGEEEPVSKSSEVSQRWQGEPLEGREMVAGGAR